METLKVDNSPLEVFKEFMSDKEASEMYIVGVAGTGKTTSLADIINYCKESNIPTITCAYTHKAVSILKDKLPLATKRNDIRTLHSYLKKVPTINDKATKVVHVDGNSVVGESEYYKVIFIDEFSMIGEKDYLDINTTQWSEKGKLLSKVVYIGDPNQLPPVKDTEVIVPKGKYQCYLTKIHRQANDNPLIDTLLAINGMINGEECKKLKEHSNFIRGVDIVEEYKKCKTSKVILAYTNEVVQDLNQEIEGKHEPELGDNLFISTLKRPAVLTATYDNVDEIKLINREKIGLGSKYNTLETIQLIKGIKFYDLQNEDLNIDCRAVVFGHYNYIKKSEELAKEAVKFNRTIQKQYNTDPIIWCKTNYKHELAKKRNEAWKKYLSFKSAVVCVDFPHALTVHKSQGSTYENVFLDIQDLGRCADRDYELYLKLMYVAISRASDKVYTN